MSITLSSKDFLMLGNRRFLHARNLDDVDGACIHCVQQKY